MSAAAHSWKRPGMRFLEVPGSQFLFIDRNEKGQPPFSPEVGRSLGPLSSLLTEDAVLLVNYDQQVEALVKLEQMAHAPIKDFTEIRTIALAPQLWHRLGRWKRQRRLQDDVWIVTFDMFKGNPARAAIRSLIETYILQPWIERSTAAVFMVGHHDLIRHGTAHYRSLLNVQNKMYDVLKTSAPASKRDADFHFRNLIVSCKRINTIQNDVYRVFAGADKSVSQHRRTNADKDLIKVVDKLQSATAELDHIYDTLPDNLLVLSSEENEVVPPEKSPVDNAIAIRERLLHSVEFVDAAKWAKWRGVKSYPSAALGKYKKQGRIFAVRSSKRDLYPAFQFANNAKPLPIMQDILKAVPQDAHGWSLLSWFEAKNVLLDGRKPADVIASNPEGVLDAAARFYSRED